MPDYGTPDLIIDKEFRSIIRPLQKEEYRLLEQNIVEDGCREAIVVWKSVIVDGHNRYEICKRLDIPFRVVEHDFASREEVIAWICDNQLGRRNISEETRKYLIGKRFQMEKVLVSKRNAAGRNQYTTEDDLVISNNPEQISERQKRLSKNRTAETIAEEYHISHGTVEKYGIYSQSLDAVAEKDPSLFPRILSGRYKISHNNVVAISKMTPAELKSFSRKMIVQKRDAPVVTYGSSRAQLQNARQVPQRTLQTGIKNMPEYDPDAAITGLTLTIPSWTNSIARIKSSENLKVVSPQAKEHLEEALENLQITIIDLLSAIKE